MVFGLFNLFRKKNSINYKGEKYSREFLEKICYSFSNQNEKFFDDSNIEIELEQSLSSKLSEEQIKEFKNWKTKQKASSWKSRQRKLRKEGKLEQYKIDALNKIGMTWDPQNDEWEHYYGIYKLYGLCEIIKDWVYEQRKLFNENKIETENLIRLKAVNFIFEPDSNEKFEITKSQAFAMINAMDKGQKTYEYVFKKREKKKLKKPQTEKKYSTKEIKKLINEIDIIYENTKQRNLKSSWGNFHVDKYFDLKQYVDGVYIDEKFNKTKFDCPEEVKVYAAEKSIELLVNKIIKTGEFNRVKSIPAINKFISHYDKKRDKEKMMYINNVVKKYSLLKQIFGERMERVMKKYL